MPPAAAKFGCDTQRGYRDHVAYDETIAWAHRPENGPAATPGALLTAATAAALALLGAIVGTAGAYAAQLAFHRSDLSPFSRVPVVNRIVILAGLPAIALVAGRLLAGREPATVARRPLE